MFEFQVPKVDPHVVLSEHASMKKPKPQVAAPALPAFDPPTMIEQPIMTSLTPSKHSHHDIVEKMTSSEPEILNKEPITDDESSLVELVTHQAKQLLQHQHLLGPLLPEFETWKIVPPVCVKLEDIPSLRSSITKVAVNRALFSTSLLTSMAWDPLRHHSSLVLETLLTIHTVMPSAARNRTEYQETYREILPWPQDLLADDVAEYIDGVSQLTLQFRPREQMAITKRAEQTLDSTLDDFLLLMGKNDLILSKSPEPVLQMSSPTVQQPHLSAACRRSSCQVEVEVVPCSATQESLLQRIIEAAEPALIAVKTTLKEFPATVVLTDLSFDDLECLRTATKDEISRTQIAAIQAWLILYEEILHNDFACSLTRLDDFVRKVAPTLSPLPEPLIKARERISEMVFPPSHHVHPKVAVLKRLVRHASGRCLILVKPSNNDLRNLIAAQLEPSCSVSIWDRPDPHQYSVTDSQKVLEDRIHGAVCFLITSESIWANFPFNSFALIVVHEFQGLLPAAVRSSTVCQVSIVGLQSHDGVAQQQRQLLKAKLGMQRQESAAPQQQDSQAPKPAIACPQPCEPRLYLASTSLTQNAELLANLENCHGVLLIELPNHDHHVDLIIDLETCLILVPVGKLQETDYHKTFVLRCLKLTNKYSQVFVLLLNEDCRTLNTQTHHNQAILLASLSAQSRCLKTASIHTLVAAGKEHGAELIRKVCETGRKIDIQEYICASQHENFLTKYPCLNNLAARVMLSRAPLPLLLSLDAEALVNLVPEVSEQRLELFAQLTHAGEAVTVGIPAPLEHTVPQLAHWPPPSAQQKNVDFSDHWLVENNQSFFSSQPWPASPPVAEVPSNPQTLNQESPLTSTNLDSILEPYLKRCASPTGSQPKRSRANECFQRSSAWPEAIPPLSSNPYSAPFSPNFTNKPHLPQEATPPNSLQKHQARHARTLTFGLPAGARAGQTRLLYKGKPPRTPTTDWFSR
eukprot:m.162510 g.162510  ORF g.162510 m.162510 type:complete len:976 (-) comp24884_c0_seq5:141-3068(-)